MEKWNKLKLLLEKSKRVLILTHKNPDGDALGSTLAFYWYLKSLGKEVNVCYVGGSFQEVEFVPMLKWDFWGDFSFLKERRNRNDYDLFLITDAFEAKRLGVFGEKLEDLPTKEELENKFIFLDHHDAPENVEGLWSFVDRNKAATSLLVYDFFKASGVEINKDAAQCLLLGIFTDTGGFLHANTDSEVIRVSSNLMRQGASISLIARNLFANKKIGTLKIWGRALMRASLNEKNKMAFTYVTQEDLKECEANLNDVSGVTNVLGAAQESKYSLFLTQTEGDRIKGSLRSEEHKNCDVSQIAKMLGGGGHRLASGFEVKGNLEDILKIIKEV